MKNKQHLLAWAGLLAAALLLGGCSQAKPAKSSSSVKVKQGKKNPKAKQHSKAKSQVQSKTPSSQSQSSRKTRVSSKAAGMEPVIKKIRAYLTKYAGNSAVRVDHKIGIKGAINNDVGYVYAKKPFVLAIFTNGWSNDQIAAVAQKIYDLAE